jgi:NADPH2:quinone reductase
MAPEGRLLVVGFASGTIPEVAVNRLLLRHLDIVGVNFGGMLPFDQRFARVAAEQLFEMLAAGRLDPLIGSRRPLAEGAETLGEMAARESIGKPVLLVR